MKSEIFLGAFFSVVIFFLVVYFGIKLLERVKTAARKEQSPVQSTVFLLENPNLNPVLHEGCSPMHCVSSVPSILTTGPSGSRNNTAGQSMRISIAGDHHFHGMIPSLLPVRPQLSTCVLPPSYREAVYECADKINHCNEVIYDIPFQHSPFEMSHDCT